MSAARHSFGEVPTEPLALRPRLAQFRPATRDRLMGWGLRQGVEARAWVMRRAAEYYAVGHADRLEDLDAVACLDLLVWQCGGLADRDALAKLEDLPVQGDLV